MLRSQQPGERYQRMPLEADVILLRRGNSWFSQCIDLSATGLLVLRPEGLDCEDEDEFNLEMVLADGNTIPLAGKVVRQDDLGIAMLFTRIPPESEEPFWELLGRFADATEVAARAANSR